MSEDVVELSIEETNKLRVELGLAPLRLSEEQKVKHGHSASSQSATANNNQASSGEEVLELSVDETNDLRAKLGLAPLRPSSKSGSTKNEAIHKPAENDRAVREAAERIQQAKLRRDIERGISQTFVSSTLADEVDTSALSWADQMRSEKRKQPMKVKSTATATSSEKYSEEDLEGIQVAHNLADLEAGSTTVLTLADAPLLQKQDDTSGRVIGLNEGDAALENVNLTENKKQQDGLRKKRLLEMGMGRAGGYAGFDDEEFEELGGTLGPARQQRGNPLLDGMDDEGTASRVGFRIGASNDANADASMSDFDKMQMGKAISLVPDKADVAASDYMTLEEENEERAKKKKKKDGKFKKKKKKKDKKRRKTQIDSDNEDEDGGHVDMNIQEVTASKQNLLAQLEETAAPESAGLRKRRRVESDDDEVNGNHSRISSESVVKQETTESKRAKFEEVMAKGNERTRRAFVEEVTKYSENLEGQLDEEPDDSFLNAAVAKARRLNRLRDMNKQTRKGAGAVAEAIKSSMQMQEQTPDSAPSSGGITFAIDDTREFTLALQARAQQKEREAEKAKQQKASANTIVGRKEDEASVQDDEFETVKVETADDDEVDIEELAKEVKTDDIDDTGLESGTARSAGVGRGLSSFISMLKTTGEITGKAGKEELKGRAKDERNYENYEPMDLSKVVKIGRNATDKDKEMANREVKLEYRDKHGRLLTTKEAFRDLCYQFHGHGASKKKEEKRLKQIEREQAQARMASRQVAAARDGTTAGTLGALKATQKATGKAFIVHKT